MGVVGGRGLTHVYKMDGFGTLQVEFTSPSGSSSTHSIYCKLHRVRQSSDLTPNDRTLFTLGWPPYCDKNTIDELFSRVGRVEETYLQSSPGPVNAKTDNDTSKRPVGFQVLDLLLDNLYISMHACTEYRDIGFSVAFVDMKR